MPSTCHQEAMLTAELNETHAIAEAEADQNRAQPHRWTQKEAREAARLSRESRATRRRSREPPSDAEIERGLRERAVSDPRAAEILLRWLQRPRADARVGGVGLDSMSERELEQLYAGFVKLATMDNSVLAALVVDCAPFAPCAIDERPPPLSAGGRSAISVSTQDHGTCGERVVSPHAHGSRAGGGTPA